MENPFILTEDIVLSVLLIDILLIYVFKKYKESLIFTLFILYFFRKPVILKNYDNRKIISPGEGKIIDIEKTDGRINISIFLSIIDNHVQLAPVDGVIKNIYYKAGEFHPAHILRKSKYNERAIITIGSEIGDVTVTCIAGMLARRIQLFKKTNTFIKKGDILSVIKFGSRVDISLPEDKVELLVSKGDKISIGGYIARIQ